MVVSEGNVDTVCLRNRFAKTIGELLHESKVLREASVLPIMFLPSQEHLSVRRVS